MPRTKSNGASTPNEEMIDGYAEPSIERLASTIFTASPPRAGRMPLRPAPTRNAPATRISGTRWSG